MDSSRIDRARGCLFGQLAGDALGSLVEFQRPEHIACHFPEGVRDLVDGGTWSTIAGQPTDDSEMALVLARSMIRHGGYFSQKALEAYLWWLGTDPFDCGSTIASALSGIPNPESQANGALMRSCPLGIAGAGFGGNILAEWADDDAALTHPHPVCRQANIVFVRTLAFAIDTGKGTSDVLSYILAISRVMDLHPSLNETLEQSIFYPPADYMRHQGWVLTALGNALWQLGHAKSLEDALVDTVSRGGDTDTNAAICGALLGAVHGLEAVPERWVETILSCRPEPGLDHVHRPRPMELWPVDAMDLADSLLALGDASKEEP
ncbi:MAG: ADP-ribosylglycohydrolase family protein [Deltaproteobacteria bacterium]|nr:ADP-ribosylglycohydrolase family protein [Deltaproteobacteria bacterium]